MSKFNFNNVTTLPKVYNNSSNIFDNKSNQSSNLFDEEEERGMLDRIFDAISVGQYTTMGAMRGLADGPGGRGVLEGIGQGLSASNPFGDGDVENEHSFSDVLGDTGWNPESTGGKVAKGVLGFAGDVLLDPLTYVSGGGSALLKGTGKGTAKALTREGAEKMVKTKLAKEGIKASGDDIARKADDFLKRYNDLHNVNQAGGGEITMSLGHAPFGKKIFGKNADKSITLAGDGAVRNFGDKTVASGYNNIREKVLGGKIGELVSTNHKLFKLSKNEPEVLYDFMDFIDKTQGLSKDVINSKKAIRAKAEMLNISPYETKQLFDLMEDKEKWHKVTKLLNDGRQAKLQKQQELKNGIKGIKEKILKMDAENVKNWDAVPDETKKLNMSRKQLRREIDEITSNSNVQKISDENLDFIRKRADDKTIPKGWEYNPKSKKLLNVDTGEVLPLDDYNKPGVEHARKVKGSRAGYKTADYVKVDPEEWSTLRDNFTTGKNGISYAGDTKVNKIAQLIEETPILAENYGLDTFFDKVKKNGTRVRSVELPNQVADNFLESYYGKSINDFNTSVDKGLSDIVNMQHQLHGNYRSVASRAKAKFGKHGDLTQRMERALELGDNEAYNFYKDRRRQRMAFIENELDMDVDDYKKKMGQVAEQEEVAENSLIEKEFKTGKSLNSKSNDEWLLEQEERRMNWTEDREPWAYEPEPDGKEYAGTDDEFDDMVDISDRYYEDEINQIKKQFDDDMADDLYGKTEKGVSDSADKSAKKKSIMDTINEIKAKTDPDEVRRNAEKTRANMTMLDDVIAKSIKSDYKVELEEARKFAKKSEEMYKSRRQGLFDEMKKTQDELEALDAKSVYENISDSKVGKLVIDDMEFDEKVIKLTKELKETFKKVRLKEVDIGKLRKNQIVENYVPRILTDAGQEYVEKNSDDLVKKGVFISDDLGYGQKWNPHSRSRKEWVVTLDDGTKKELKTITEINDYMRPMLDNKNMFSESIADIYVARMTKNVDLMYDNEYMNTMMNRFGEKVTSVNKMDIKDGQKLATNFGALREQVSEMVFSDKEFSKRIKVLYDEIKTNPKRSTQIRETIDDLVDERSKKVLSDIGLPEETLKGKATPMVELDSEQARSILNKIPNVSVSKVNSSIVDKANQARKLQMLKDQHRSLELFDKFTHLWKLNVTTVIPGFHARNKMANMFQNWLAVGTDAFDPKLQKDSWETFAKQGDVPFDKVVRNADGSTALYKDPSTGKETVLRWSDIYGEAKARGVIDEGFFANQARTVKGENGALKRFGVKGKFDPTDAENFIGYTKGAEVGSHIENSDRLAHFVAQLKNGYSFDEASQSVNKFLFDYSDLTQFEQQYMKRVVPFYTWMRKNVPLQVDQMLNNPNKYRAIAKGLRNINDMTPDDEKVDRSILGDYAKSWVQLPIEITGEDGEKEPIMWNPNLPMYDLERLPNPLKPLEGLKDILTQSNPLIKVPIELASNKNMFFDSPIAREDENRVGKSAEHIANQVAMPRIAKDLLTKRGADGVMNVLNQGAGMKFASINEKDAKVRAIMRRLEEQKQ